MTWLATVAAAVAAPWATALPAVDTPETRDGVHVVAGGWRAEVHEGGVTWATVGFLTEIAAYAQTPSGWLFVDATGDVTTSLTFLGDPIRLPPLGQRLHAAVSGDGVITVEDATGHTWWSTGGPMRELVHPAGALLSAAFLDPLRGAAITEGGALWQTADGATTWARVDTGSEIPYWVDVRPDLVAWYHSTHIDTLATATTPPVALAPSDLAALQPGLRARQPGPRTTRRR